MLSDRRSRRAGSRRPDGADLHRAHFGQMSLQGNRPLRLVVRASRSAPQMRCSLDDTHVVKLSYRFTFPHRPQDFAEQPDTPLGDDLPLGVLEGRYMLTFEMTRPALGSRNGSASRMAIAAMIAMFAITRTTPFVAGSKGDTTSNKNIAAGCSTKALAMTAMAVPRKCYGSHLAASTGTSRARLTRGPRL